MKKEGAEIPSTLVKMAVVSIQVSFFMAARIPSAIPVIVAMNIARKASRIVPGKASISIDQTSFRV